MGLLRVSIVGLMAAVVVFALGFAALRSGSPLWMSAIYTLTTLILLVAVVTARFRRGREGAFWFGFAVFGWGIFLLGLRPWAREPGSLGPYSDVSTNPNLLTSRLLYWLLPRLRPDTDDLKNVGVISEKTLEIAHLLVTLTIAFCGGLLAVLIRRRRRPAPRRNGLTTGLWIVAGCTLTLTAIADSLPPAPRTAFFPRQVRNETSALEDFSFCAEWYGEHLAAMGEPSLWLQARDRRASAVYRLLWLPSGSHSVCVRITPEGDGAGARLHAVVLDGLDGNEPGHAAIRRSRVLGPDEWALLADHLEQANFWNMPTTLSEGGGSDGEQLIVEGVRNGQYHMVDRWEPDPAYSALCRAMLAATGLKDDQERLGDHLRENYETVK